MVITATIRHTMFPGDFTAISRVRPALMPLPRPDVPAGRKTASDFDLSTDHPLVRAVYTAALRVSLDFIAKEKFSKRWTQRKYEIK
jgi:hypothetical protein